MDDDNFNKGNETIGWVIVALATIIIIGATFTVAGMIG